MYNFNSLADRVRSDGSQSAAQQVNTITFSEQVTRRNDSDMEEPFSMTYEMTATGEHMMLLKMEAWRAMGNAFPVYTDGSGLLDGYCYLAFFPPAIARSAAKILERYPFIGDMIAVRNYMERKYPDYPWKTFATGWFSEAESKRGVAVYHVHDDPITPFEGVLPELVMTCRRDEAMGVTSRVGGSSFFKKPGVKPRQPNLNKVKFGNCDVCRRRGVYQETAKYCPNRQLMRLVKGNFSHMPDEERFCRRCFNKTAEANELLADQEERGVEEIEGGRIVNSGGMEIFIPDEAVGKKVHFVDEPDLTEGSSAVDTDDSLFSDDDEPIGPSVTVDESYTGDENAFMTGAIPVLPDSEFLQSYGNLQGREEPSPPPIKSTLAREDFDTFESSPTYADVVKLPGVPPLRELLGYGDCVPQMPVIDPAISVTIPQQVESPPPKKVRKNARVWQRVTTKEIKVQQKGPLTLTRGRSSPLQEKSVGKLIFGPILGCSRIWERRPKQRQTSRYIPVSRPKHHVRTDGALPLCLTGRDLEQVISLKLGNRYLSRNRAVEVGRWLKTSPWNLPWNCKVVWDGEGLRFEPWKGFTYEVVDCFHFSTGQRPKRRQHSDDLIVRHPGPVELQTGLVQPGANVITNRQRSFTQSRVARQRNLFRLDLSKSNEKEQVHEEGKPRREGVDNDKQPRVEDETNGESVTVNEPSERGRSLTPGARSVRLHSRSPSVLKRIVNRLSPARDTESESKRQDTRGENGEPKSPTPPDSPKKAPKFADLVNKPTLSSFLVERFQICDIPSGMDLHQPNFLAHAKLNDMRFSIERLSDKVSSGNPRENLLKLITLFFERTQVREISGRYLAAMCHIYKHQFGCPEGQWVVDFDTTENKVTLYKGKIFQCEGKGAIMWWSVNGYLCVHCGSDADEERRGRSRSPLEAIRRRFSRSPDHEEDAATAATASIRKRFGLKPSQCLKPVQRPNHFLSNYNEHYVIDYLSKNKQWVSKTPCWLSRPSLNGIQDSLDCITGLAKVKFHEKLVGELVEFVRTYLNRMETNVIEGATLTAIAHLIKAKWDCPNGQFALEVCPEEREILIHYSAKPTNTQSDNALWWVLNGYNCAHAGGKRWDPAYARLVADEKRHNYYRQEYRQLAALYNEEDSWDETISEHAFMSNMEKVFELKDRDWLDMKTFCTSGTPLGTKMVSTDTEAHATRHGFDPRNLRATDRTLSEKADFRPQLRELIAACGLAWYWHFILTLFLAFFKFYSSWYHPDFDEDSDNVEWEGDIYSSDQAVDDVKDSLLVCAYGSHGDQVPVRYLANIAGHMGVKVKYHVFADLKQEDLTRMQKGELWGYLPSYANLIDAENIGYKKVLSCYQETQNGESYLLSPTTDWINPLQFIDRDSNLTWWNRVMAFSAEMLATTSEPTWRVGVLAGSSLPRSRNGVTALKRIKNTGVYAEGWTHGSDSPEVIPIEIRKRCPKIPSGDHEEIFPEYKVIHCHGGAGTMQTAIACGATAVSHSKLLDRDYKKPPTEEDFRQPSCASYIGWLCWAGFVTDLPMDVKIIALCAYAWHKRWTILANASLAIIKAYAIGHYFVNKINFLILIFFTSPPFVWKYLYREGLLTTATNKVIRSVWDYPIFCVADTNAGAAVALLGIKTLSFSALRDYRSWQLRGQELLWEPVVRKGITFPFPLGHWGIRDNTDGSIYEGRFTPGYNGWLGAPFGMRRNTNKVIKEGSRFFPAPVNILKVRQLTREGDRPYNGHHNCVTLLVRSVWGEGFCWSLASVGVCAMTYLALSPPQYFKTLLNKLYPNNEIENTYFYQGLGWAAGIEQIPIEPEQEIEEPVLPIQSINEIESPPPIDYADENLLESLVAELACIQKNLRSASVFLDEDDHREVTERTFLKALEEVPDPVGVTESDIPPYVKHSWAQVVDDIHSALGFIRQNRVIDCFICWLKTITGNVVQFVFPILDALAWFLDKAYGYSKKAFKRLFDAGCHFLDHVWGIESTSRVKTVWGLTGLNRTGMLGVKAKLAANIEYAKRVGRTDFQSDYDAFVREAKAYASRYHAAGKNTIGGPQHRKIGYSKPLMTETEAKLLGFKPGEFVTDSDYTARIESYLAEGVKQGGDGVFLADKFPELIAKSQHRYEPKYPDIHSDDRAFAMEIAQAMFEHDPATFANCDVVPPRAVHNYVKAKYSPGTPFINGKSFKSRQAMFDAGFDKVLQKKAQDYLESGKYPVQFYHAFVKSQVVDIQKCLPEHVGGSNKDVRTVVSQDLFSYYIDQCLQIERNKRPTWDTYGAGIGMPLNQSMEKIYSELADAQKARGGRYIMMDGKAFDSKCKPFLFEVNACLWELGFKDHPSGNGKNLASVIRASYDARQQAWIIGVTEKENSSLTVGSFDEISRKAILNGFKNKKLVKLEELLPADWRTWSKQRLQHYVADIEPPQDCTILTFHRDLVPKKSNWMGNFQYGDTIRSSQEFFKNQTFLYEKDNTAAMLQDIEAVVGSNHALLSNVHYKNRGGSTGGSDTSNVNTHAYKAGIIYAWCKTTGMPPKDFFKYNTLKNTSDDSIWQTGGKHGLNTVQDVATFQKHALDVGIRLEIDTTKNINQVEYLSKFVRVPTATDSDALRKWRAQKFKAICHAHTQQGRPVPTTYDELNNPRFVVTQNPSAILLRRSAFRYYQSSADKWRYVSAARGAGHANSVAFVPELYNRFAIEWCDDVNILLKKHNIHRKYRPSPNGQFGLPTVEQFDPRASQQALSPRQKAFLEWLKGNMYPSYYRVLDTHMNVRGIDPLQHSKLLKKLEKGWRGWDQITREGVDGLFAMTDAIPDEWSKKFQPSVEMLYAEIPFYTRNKVVERMIYKSMLMENPDVDAITFGDFSSRVQESPYAGCCDVYHFWEVVNTKQGKEEIMATDFQQDKGLVMMISLLYMCTTAMEAVIFGIPFLGTLYKLFLWSFMGLNKVYGILNTMYWHSTGKSSREISRIMPRDPYITSKRACAFVVDLLPSIAGMMLLLPTLILDLFPPALELVAKVWYEGGTLKSVEKRPNAPGENPWSSYAEEFVNKARTSPTRRAYVAAGTGTGKSTMFIAAIWGTRHRTNIRKIWLIEPRKVLRDETKVPFDIGQQALQRGVALDNRTDIYVCTYGHMQNRLDDMDPENDIVLFDEFHEEQGEMIKGLHDVKAPILLLSATPSEIPDLVGSPYLTPNIKRRFPIHIHKCPDSMNVVDMYMEAQNKYPDLMDRALVVVPTHKEVQKTINALLYLGAGTVNPLTRFHRHVPETGVIVSTPYVQTGLDIKPPPKILIDCGKDLVINKGAFVNPIPWTDSNINKQRIGRVGRLTQGVVYQPTSAGTGAKPTFYPSPQLFSDGKVAQHFKMPQLQPVKGGFLKEMPFFCIDKAKLPEVAHQKAVTLIHAFAMQGMRQTEWSKFYTRLQAGERLNEDYDFINHVNEYGPWVNYVLPDYNIALYHLNREKITAYNIEGFFTWSKPLAAINGRWVELDENPTDQFLQEELDTKTVKSKYVKLQSQLDKLRSGIVKQSALLGPDKQDKLFSKLMSS
uniref:Polyprotein n=1 Tax=Hulunbuir tick virus 1 TaxID=2972183 RepID=A0A9E8A9W4_9VIRU|nr:MAG: polyprotein [Hulunbuir tick virus 1]